MQGTDLFRDFLYRLSAPASGSHTGCKIAPRPGVSRADSISLIQKVRPESSLGIGHQVVHGASLSRKLFAHTLASLVLVVQSTPGKSRENQNGCARSRRATQIVKSKVYGRAMMGEMNRKLGLGCDLVHDQGECSSPLNQLLRLGKLSSQPHSADFQLRHLRYVVQRGDINGRESTESRGSGHLEWGRNDFWAKISFVSLGFQLISAAARV
jgi:hypothetical protein